MIGSGTLKSCRLRDVYFILLFLLLKYCDLLLGMAVQLQALESFGDFLEMEGEPARLLSHLVYQLE